MRDVAVNLLFDHHGEPPIETILTPGQKSLATKRANGTINAIAQRAAATRTGRAPVLDPYVKRLRASMAGAIGFAKARQMVKTGKGRGTVAVNVTVDELMILLARQDYRCALSGIEFYTGTPHSFGARRPSLDRLEPDGPYDASNIRVVCLGLNSLRGRGTDAEMFELMRATLTRIDLMDAPMS